MGTEKEIAMNIQAEKTALIKVLEQTNDESLIQAIQHMVNYAVKRDEEYLGTTIDQYNLELEEAETRIAKGEFIDHEKAITQIQGWRNKEK